MGIFDSVTNQFGKGTEKPHNTYISTSARCRIKIFHFKDPNPDPESTDSSVMDVEVINLESRDNHNPLVGLTFTKSNAAAAGFFQLSLLPTQNWLQFLKPGDWIVVYLTNGKSQSEKIRCFGTVDTINFTDSIDPNSGARMVVFSVSGRDFGKVFEKYFIYINIYLQSNAGQELYLKQLLIGDMLHKIEGGPDYIVKTLINTFLGGEIDKNMQSDQKQLKQWLIPSKLSDEIINSSSSTQFNQFPSSDVLQQGAQNLGQKVGSNLGQSISQTAQSIDAGIEKTTNAINNAANNLGNSLGGGVGGDNVARFLNILSLDNIQEGLDGYKLIMNLDVHSSLWTLMQQHANLLLNEMFCEMTDDGRPGVFLRMNPFTFQDYSDPMGIIDGNLRKFLDLPSVQISGSEILSGMVGLSENDRVNFIMLLSDILESSVGNVNSSLVYLMGKFPYINAASCLRHGLNVFEFKTDYGLVPNKPFYNQDPNILASWNYVLKHWWENNAFFEHGSLTIVGREDIRIGKRLDIVDGPFLMGAQNGTTKSFYIESYVDNWSYGSMWTQTLTLTRGVYVKNGKEELTYKEYSDGAGSNIGLNIISRK